MTHQLSAADRAFRAAFERCDVAPDTFDHRAHVRLAYAYLVDRDDVEAVGCLRSALQRFLAQHGIPASKYHETLTQSWILAVRHFMATSAPAASADEFIATNPRLLDAKIMLTHYSAEVLFSADARARFVEPDVQPIPRHPAS